MASYGSSSNVIHKSPTMYGWGDINVWRDGNNIRITGTASVRKPAGSSSNPSRFGYHYAARINWNGRDTGNWFYIKDNNSSYSGKNITWSKNFDITLWNYTDAGTVSLIYICCGSGDGTYGKACTVGWSQVEV